MDLYILEGDTPIAAANIEEWKEWYKHADRKIKSTYYNDKEIHVSTAFLGHSSTVLFETMIFGGSPYKNEQWRYATKDEAVEGHAKACEKVEDWLLAKEEPYNLEVKAVEDFLKNMAAQGYVLAGANDTLTGTDLTKAIHDYYKEE